MAHQVNGRNATYPGKAATLQGYVVSPTGAGRFPAVIVVQEWWGLDDHIKDVARRLAAEGYFTIAPDLYSRQGHQVTKDPNVAGELSLVSADLQTVAEKFCRSCSICAPFQPNGRVLGSWSQPQGHIRAPRLSQNGG